MSETGNLGLGSVQEVISGTSLSVVILQSLSVRREYLSVIKVFSFANALSETSLEHLAASRLMQDRPNA